MAKKRRHEAPRLPLAALSLAGFHVDSKPLTPAVASELRARAWHPGCPVPLSDLRILTVTYWGFDSERTAASW